VYVAVVAVLAGGSYVRCFDAVSGSLQWESSVVSAVSNHRASLQFINNGAFASSHQLLICNVALSLLIVLFSTAEVVYG